MLQVGQRLGEFEIVRLLGKGGMGEVYEALQSNPSRPVALKILAPWLAENDDALQRFWREAEVPARLDHPSIVRIISMGKTPEGTAYFTMQLVRGISLAELIRRATDAPEPSTTAAATACANGPAQETPTNAGMPFPVSPPPSGEVPRDVLQEYLHDRFGFVARHGAQAARALAYAHSQGVLHRDIKPSNLMIDHHKQLYIVDFGLTRGLGPNALGSQPGPVRGTPWYMSPEQARGQVIDQRADIYALGVSLYELATRGVGPFTASRESAEAVLAQVRAGQCLPLRMLTPEMPRPLEQVILKAMHRKAAMRYRSALEMAEELERLGQSGGGSGSPLPAPSVPARGRRPWSWGRILVPAAALLLLVAGLWWLATARFGIGSALEVSEVTPRESAATYPNSLLNREPGIVASLLRDSLEPVYGRTKMGPGAWSVINRELVLESPPPPGPDPSQMGTYLALDDDPQGRWFTVEAQIRADLTTTPETYACGLFFGMRHAKGDPTRFDRFFAIQLLEGQAATRLGPSLEIGSALIHDKRAGQAGWYDPLRTLVDKDPSCRYPLTRPGPWHKISIQTGPERMHIRADDGPLREFDYARLRQAWPQDPSINASLDPRGALGLWVRNGRVVCRHATICEPK